MQIHWSVGLGGSCDFTFCVNKLRIKINTSIPFNRVERDTDPPKRFAVFETPKYAKVQKLFHVQIAALAIVKNNGKYIILTGDYFYH